MLGKRGNSGYKEDDSVVNSLLQEIDGISGHSGIIIIAATNHPELIDEAAMSRFDKKITLQLPTQKERSDIVDKILSKQRRNDTVAFPE